jgi:hypothetical protein
MEDPLVDDATADALLDGRVDPEHAPAGLRAAAELVRAAKSSAPGVDETCSPELMTALLAAARGAGDVVVDGALVGDAVVGDAAVPDDNVVAGNFGRLRGTRISARVAAAAAAFALVGGGVAAAATGSLPRPIQSAASTALAQVGISIPHPGGPAAPDTSDGTGTAGDNLPTLGSSTTTRLRTRGYATTPTTRPAGHAASGPPLSTPVGPPVSTPVGPPVNTPVGPPVSTPVGPPVSTPVGPPVINPVDPPVTDPPVTTLPGHGKHPKGHGQHPNGPPGQTK